MVDGGYVYCIISVEMGNNGDDMMMMMKKYGSVQHAVANHKSITT